MPIRRTNLKLKPDALRVALAKINKSQTDLANHLGYHRTWVFQVKNGFYSPSKEDAKKVAKFLKCSMKDVFEERPR